MPYKKADEKFGKEFEEGLKQETIREFLKLHTVYVIEATAFAYSREKVESLKELLHREGFFVRVYRRLI